MLLIELKQRLCQARSETQDRRPIRDFQRKTETVEIASPCGLGRMLSRGIIGSQITQLVMHFYNHSRPLGYILQRRDLSYPHSLPKVANLVWRHIKGLANSPPQILNDKNIRTANLR